ncbi:NUDIX domain-containing protein [Subtercola endophyticus]|uniref:NUDIX domain-containing protein n=1 Tax=Subtercola endophyticus TaxID=2895559 RepID=UPI001E4AF48D|nr:NUDIX domain-containing protein [Subtercola endophyticus]UFS59836.1 NUDIX domain-containing protein [Subtercola endophyticus]
MPIVSSGILLYRGPADAPEVFIARMGGPFWPASKVRAWSLPKGLNEGDEESLATARREFREEVGVDAPPLPYELLGDFRQKSGKIVRVFTARADAPGADGVVPHAASLAFVGSNTFSTEWPPRSGRQQEFPEIAEARWLPLAEAANLLVEGQVAVLDALRQHLGGA